MKYLFRGLEKVNSFNFFLLTFLIYVYWDPLCYSEADFARINQSSIAFLKFGYRQK